MHQIINPCHDPFFIERLNPLFFKEWESYWNMLLQAKIPKEQEEEAIKAAFNLLAFGFRNLMKPFYTGHLVKIKGPVHFIACVFKDGLGDYFALLKSAQTVKKAFAELNIQIAFTHEVPLPTVSLEDYGLADCVPQAFFFTEKEQMRTFEDLLSLKVLPEHADAEIKKLYQKLQKSLAIIHIALAFNTFDHHSFSQKSFYFAETGNFQGIGNYLQKNWFSMGLKPFEEGMFLKKQREAIGEKKGNNASFVGYLTTNPKQQLIFLYLICLIQKNDSRNIEILFPRLKNIKTWPFDELWLFQQGIAKIVMNGNETLIDTGHPSDKTLLIKQILPLPANEFIESIERSEELAGCTGDVSLSDCLAADKIPYYEIRAHKKSTVDALLGIANILKLQSASSYLSSMADFESESAEKHAENLYGNYRNETFKTEWAALRDFIKKHYCFEDSLIAHLNRHFAGLKNPSLFQLEEKIIHNYMQGTLSAREAYRLYELKNPIA